MARTCEPSLLHLRRISDEFPTVPPIEKYVCPEMANIKLKLKGNKWMSLIKASKTLLLKGIESLPP